MYSRRGAARSPGLQRHSAPRARLSPPDMPSDMGAAIQWCNLAAACASPMSLVAASSHQPRRRSDAFCSRWHWFAALWNTRGPQLPPARPAGGTRPSAASDSNVFIEGSVPGLMVVAYRSRCPGRTESTGGQESGRGGAGRWRGGSGRGVALRCCHASHPLGRRRRVARGMPRTGALQAELNVVHTLSQTRRKSNQPFASDPKTALGSPFAVTV